MKPSERPMPFDADLEWMLIGSCLKDNRVIDRIAEIIEPEDFFLTAHRRTFEVILVLQPDGDVTPELLAAMMKNDAILTQHGIADPFHYFRTLTAGAPVAPNIPSMARAVKDYSQRRTLIRLAEEIAADAATGMLETPVQEIVEKYQAVADQIAASTNMGEKRQPISAADATDQMLRRIEEQAVAERPHGVSTGIDWLDKIIGGLFPGKLIVAAGRPGMGKSILATNLSRAASPTIPVDYLSGEMDTDELSARVGADLDFDEAMANGLPPLQYGDFTQLRATGAALERMAVASRRLSDPESPFRLTFIDAPHLTLEWAEAIIRRRCRQEPGHRLVIIDHLQLMDLQFARRSANRNEIQTEITKRLKGLAKELGITILLLSQLSRDVEKRDDKHPQLSDLREGGSIEQDADVVIGILRPLIYARARLQAARNEEQRHKAILEYDEAKDVLEIAVLKNRGGRSTEYVKIFIKPEASAIRDKPPSTGAASLIDWGKLAEDLR